MPTYQYVCTACERPLEAQQSFADEALTVCPVCAGRLRKVFSAVGVVFKGSGFYRNDSRAASNAGANGSTANGSGSNGDGSGSDKSADKTGDKAGDKTGDKTAEKTGGKTGSTSGDRSGDTGSKTAPARDNTARTSGKEPSGSAA